MTTDLGKTAVTHLKGVGPALEKKLAQLQIQTYQDLLFHLPHRYEDRTRVYPLADLQPGQYALVEGTVVSTHLTRGKRRQLIVQIIEGQTTLQIVFFHFYPNQPKAYPKGVRLRCFGQVTHRGWQLMMVHPEIERLQATQPTPLIDYLTAVYPTVKGLSQKYWRQAINQVLQLNLSLIDGLPPTLCAEKQWPSFQQALQFLHQPPPSAELSKLLAADYPAMQRLIAEELLAHQLTWQQYRQQTVCQSTTPLVCSKHDKARFIEQLPFTLTTAQTKVVTEIEIDGAQHHPMMRLLQGDVGSGKTVVAAIAALMAISVGKKVALMAPTALLVRQHYQNFCTWFKEWDIPILELTGMTTAKARRTLHQQLGADEPAILIGTHALIQPDVTIKNLGLVVIDEQHRFGVAQRLALCEKNPNEPPHQLIMTATPIPRTLLMTYFTDMAVSLLDERPKGRQPIQTVVVSAKKRDDIVQRIQAVCTQGEQVYWVCPLIEASEQLAAQSALETMTALQAELPTIKVGLVHGKLPTAEKTAIMAAFRAGEIQLLVATTVIEVGVDVPNATLMVIENAERLGLAQAHQLRGRVGRGHKQSYCVLLYEGALSPTASERLSVLRASEDGFVIAEKDLTLRGPGEVLGTRQAGGQQFKLADISRDQAQMEAMAALAPSFWHEYPKEREILISRWCAQRIPFAKV